MECYFENVNEQFKDCGEVYEIAREFATEEAKRIDLLIKTEQYLIVIENKIYAGVNNPFELYHKTANSVAGGTDIKEILLTLKDEHDVDKNGYHFVNITYEKLLNRVTANLGSYVGKSNYKWLLFMNEFMNNIKSFYEGEDLVMNTEWNKFISDKNNSELLYKTISSFMQDIDDKRIWLEEVRNKINDEFNPFTHANGKNSYKGYSSIVIDFCKNDNDIYTLEPYFCKDMTKDGNEWEKTGVFYICIWKRKNKSGLADLKAYLEEKGYENLKISINGSWGDCLAIKELSFGNAEEISSDKVAENISVVANEIRDYVNKMEIID